MQKRGRRMGKTFKATDNGMIAETHSAKHSDADVQVTEQMKRQSRATWFKSIQPMRGDIKLSSMTIQQKKKDANRKVSLLFDTGMSPFGL